MVANVLGVKKLEKAVVISVSFEDEKYTHGVRVFEGFAPKSIRDTVMVGDRIDNFHLGWDREKKETFAYIK